VFSDRLAWNCVNEVPNFSWIGYNTHVLVVSNHWWWFEIPSLVLCWHSFFVVCLCKFCCKVRHTSLCGFCFASFWAWIFMCCKWIHLFVFGCDALLMVVVCYLACVFVDNYRCGHQCGNAWHLHWSWTQLPCLKILNSHELDNWQECASYDTYLIVWRHWAYKLWDIDDGELWYLANKGLGMCKRVLGRYTKVRRQQNIWHNYGTFIQWHMTTLVRCSLQLVIELCFKYFKKSINMLMLTSLLRWKFC
jgi:hypothetical protein